MTRYVLSEDGSLCAPNDATEDADLLIDWDEFYAMRQRAEGAERALRKYSHHLAECDYIVEMLPCTCGLDAVRAASQAQHWTGEVSMGKRFYEMTVRELEAEANQYEQIGNAMWAQLCREQIALHYRIADAFLSDAAEPGAKPDIADVPHITESGALYWNVRDIVHGPHRVESPAPGQCQCGLYFGQTCARQPCLMPAPAKAEGERSE